MTDKYTELAREHLLAGYGDEIIDEVVQQEIDDLATLLRRVAREQIAGGISSITRDAPPPENMTISEGVAYERGLLAAKQVLHSRAKELED